MTDYLTEPVVWGGLPSTRGRIIETMERQGFPRVAIDRYLQGFDLFTAAQGKEEQ